MGDQLAQSIKQKRAQRTYVVGLTGGFGSGKSTVLHAFRKCGASIFDCDAAAHAALQSGSPLIASLRKCFGPAIIGEDGAVDRSRLGALIFTNTRKKRQLEKIMHPFIIARMRSFIKRARGLVVVEVPLLYEARLMHLFDAIVVVYAPQRTILARLKKKYPALSERALLRRIRAQLSLRTKAQRADHVILNTSVRAAAERVYSLAHIFKTNINA